MPRALPGERFSLEKSSKVLITPGAAVLAQLVATHGTLEVRFLAFRQLRSRAERRDASLPERDVASTRNEYPMPLVLGDALGPYRITSEALSLLEELGKDGETAIPVLRPERTA